MTRPRPIAPAIRPACSCSPPRAAVTVLTLASLKVSGSAPYFSMLARSCASVCVKLPEISALPPVSAWLTYGSETTSPSRTMANWFCGDWFFASLPVMSANFLEPPDVKSMVTFQPAALWVSKTAAALLMSVPETSAAPSTYFCHWPEEFLPQATVGSVGLTPSPAVARTALSVQSSAAYWAWSLAVAGSTLPLGDGVAAVEADDFAEALADGVLSAFRASVTARPWEVAVADGVAELDDVALSVALPVALSFEESLLEALGEGLAVAAFPATSVASTGRK